MLPMKIMIQMILPCLLVLVNFQAAYADPPQDCNDGSGGIIAGCKIYDKVPSYDQDWLDYNFNGYWDLGESNLNGTLGICTQTSLAMILGYYDNNGWSNFVPYGRSDPTTNPQGVKYLREKIVEQFGSGGINKIDLNSLAGKLNNVVQQFDANASFITNRHDYYVSWSDIKNGIKAYGPMLLSWWNPTYIQQLYYFKNNNTDNTVSSIPQSHTMVLIGYVENYAKWGRSSTTNWLLVKGTFNNGILESEDPWWIDWNDLSWQDISIVSFMLNGIPSSRVDTTDDNWEDNDSPEKASTPGSPFNQASLKCNDDDWFEFTIDPNTTLNASINFIQSRGELGLQLYDASLNLLDSGIGATNQKSVQRSTPVTGGTYYLKIFGINGAKNSYSINVTTVSPGVLDVSPIDHLMASGNQSGPFGPSTTIQYTLINNGGKSINWTATKNQSWVNLSSAGGTLDAGGSTPVTVSLNASANILATGNYSDIVTFIDTTNNTSVSRNVTLGVGNSPTNRLSVTPDAGLTAICYQGGTCDHTYLAYTLTNIVGGALTWRAQITGPWAYLGNPGPNSINTIYHAMNLSVMINETYTATLSPGTYSDTVRITDSDGIEQIRSVNLIVLPPPGNMSISTGNLYSVGTQGGPFSPSSVQFTVMNTGGDTINWTAENIQPWISLSSLAGQLAAGASTVVTVSTNNNANGLTPGNYGETITFTNTTNNNGDATRSVGLTVNVLPGSLSVSPLYDLTSAGLQGRPLTPSSQEYTLQNTGNTSINWSASTAQPWAILSSTGGTLSAGATTTVVVTIGASANSLSVGSYSDTINFINSTNGKGNEIRAVNLLIESNQLAFTTSPLSLPSGTINTQYNQQIIMTAVKGSAPYSYTCQGAGIAGLTTSTSGNICSVGGHPTAAGIYRIDFTVTDFAGTIAIAPSIEIIFNPIPIITGIVDLPSTGQITCYNSAGISYAAINCLNSGQDGEFRTGVILPIRRFTANYDTSIIDNLTGLLWAPDGNLIATRNNGWDTDGTAIDGKVTWQHALDYVAKLNVENYLGHNDWRLPNVREMRSLVNYSKPNSGSWLSTQGFTNVQNLYSEGYWTSTTEAADPTAAYSVDTFSGNITYQVVNIKSMVYRVWPVRNDNSMIHALVNLPKTGQSKCYDSSGSIISCANTGQDGESQKGVAWPNPRFTINYDTSIIDNLTGLLWAPDGNLVATRDNGWDTDGTANDGKVTWQHALDYVAKLKAENYLGHDDWRLPNVNELESLVNYDDPVINSHGDVYSLLRKTFANIQWDLYWSSSTKTDYPVNASSIILLMGGTYSGWKDNNMHVLPVRGGKLGALSPNTMADGDLDGNGVTDSVDALLALRIAVGAISSNSTEFLHGDVSPLVNGVPQPDGKIDVGDVVLILRKAVHFTNW